MLLDISKAAFFFQQASSGMPLDETTDSCIEYLTNLRRMSQAIAGSGESTPLLKGLDEFLKTQADYVIRTEVARLQSRALIFKFETLTDRMVKAIQIIQTKVPSRLIDGLGFEDLEKLAKDNKMELVPLDDFEPIPLPDNLKDAQEHPRVNVNVNMGSTDTAKLIADIISKMQQADPTAGADDWVTNFPTAGTPMLPGSEVYANYPILSQFPPLPKQVQDHIKRINSLIERKVNPKMIRPEIEKLKSRLAGLSVEPHLVEVLLNNMSAIAL